jgi:threonine synthase
MGSATKLTCSRCRNAFDPHELLNLCSCGGPLLVEYDLQSIRQTWDKQQLRNAPHSMWRYAPVLPADAEEAITLNEGYTPLTRAFRLGAAIGASNLWIKDEGRNPTDSFKAR